MASPQVHFLRIDYISPTVDYIHGIATVYMQHFVLICKRLFATIYTTSEVHTMDITDIILLITIGAAAGFIQRVSGFGLAIFAMMFLPYFSPSHTAAVAIACLFSTATTVFNTVRYYRDIDYKICVPMLCTALPAITVAVCFSSLVSARVFSILLGIVLIGLSAYFLFFIERISIRPTLSGGLFVGVLSGVLGGLFSTSGPPVVLYLSNAAPDNAVYFATIQFYFCITNIYSTVVRAANGIIDGTVLLWAAVGIVGCLIGDALGTRVFRRLDSSRLKRIIYIGMILSGILMLF